MKPETFNHAVLHVIKYVGEAANIAEKLDHHNERGEAIRLAKEFLRRRDDHMEVSWGALIEHLTSIVEEES